jgi:pyruvate dehydrogenase E1 component alpha subunit
MESAVVDGMDVMSVYNGFKPLVDRCRESSRPMFVDVRTYRFKGHSMSDPRKYRTKDEEKQYEENDPIDKFANWLTEEGHVSEENVRRNGEGGSEGSARCDEVGG